MKTYKHIYISLVSLILIGFASCEKIEDIEPLFTLDAEIAIVDENSANLVLIGAYSGFRQKSISSGFPEIFMVPSKLSGLGLSSPFGRPTQEGSSYDQNNPDTNGSINLGAYTNFYDVINRANWLINGVTKLTDDNFTTPGRRDEMLGEAKALRALAHFYLLRQWGQFYDSSSAFGITVNTEPSRSSKVSPRSTVSDSYAQIIDDLNDAIAMAPDGTTKIFANKTFAKGLKAKVLLYQGKYAEAATLAKDVIDNSGGNFSLATTYDEIFDNSSPALFDSTEVLFGSRGENGAASEGLGMGNFWGAQYIVVSPSFLPFTNGTINIGGQQISYDGSRAATHFVQFSPAPFLDNAKYSFAGGEIYEMIYHLRMSEIYLIYAESDARANNMVTTNSLNALNFVRTRAGATTTGGNGFETYPASISLNQFLETVRIEKYIELAGETGEEWFDLVRYHFVDGFDVSSVKPTATNPDKFILPIPSLSIEAGGNVVAQNPSY